MLSHAEQATSALSGTGAPHRRTAQGRVREVRELEGQGSGSLGQPSTRDDVRSQREGQQWPTDRPLARQRAERTSDRNVADTVSSTLSVGGRHSCRPQPASCKSTGMLLAASPCRPEPDAQAQRSCMHCKLAERAPTIKSTRGLRLAPDTRLHRARTHARTARLPRARRRPRPATADGWIGPGLSPCDEVFDAMRRGAIRGRVVLDPRG